MISIQEVYETRRANQNLSLFECVMELGKKYEIEEKDLGLFVKSNKTLLNELQKECAEKRLLKSSLIMSSLSIETLY